MKEKIKLIGREKETASIDKLMHSGRAEFLAVYGRRRVGKTFLIRQYLKNNMVFDFTGTKDGAKEQQLINFFEEYTKRAGNRKKKQVPLTWHEAFGYLASYLRQLSKRKIKHVVFIDEMPWIDTPKSEFISALEFLWNQHLSKMDNVLLIACGSASSWIKKKLIKSRGGLYNRVTHRIHLKPFNLFETELFLNNLGIKLSRYQVLEIYMAMGGIPFYLNEISKGKSAAQFIDSTCFVAGGLLHDEYSQLYHSLFKNADNHIHIIEALASRPQGMARTEIASKIKISEGSLSRAMEELIDCDFVSKYQPLIHKKKTSVYKLTDAYSLFYLKFIKTHKGSGKGTWEQLYKSSSFQAWSGYAFENIWLVHPSQLRRALGISGVYTILSSWKFTGNDALPGAQIDMIIDRADNTIHLCEAKFTKENFAITKNYGEQLKLKKTILKQATQTKKTIFTTLLTTYPAMRNKYYLEEIENEITMDKLFEPN
ncbi:MAG TPA: ATP-binding protein [Bacteroidia bacterium]|nr:ATP-binding protein [Bacteroidia bacterium]